jgi:hypothetical protein
VHAADICFERRKPEERKAVPQTTAFEGEPLGEGHRGADCSLMLNIGSVGLLAFQVAQPFVVSQASSVDATRLSADSSGGSAAGEGAGIVSSEAFSGDYAMSLLAKITHASADQALALIQGLLT